MAHRLVGHPGACARIHGHNYSFEITVRRFDGEGLNTAGMVTDFADIEAVLFSWLDDNWDHRLMLWEGDPLLRKGRAVLEAAAPGSLAIVAFHPTAENMARHLLAEVFPVLIERAGLPVGVTEVSVRETAGYAAFARKESA
jgi:6-pyruvoyltetrahydropterin/6-carboxytetrahydropterin synthase